MALQIHVIKRKIMAGLRAGEEWFYGKVRLRGRQTFEKLCEQASVSTTLTAADMEAVMNGVTTIICQHLENGNIVDLVGFGKMRLSAGSEGVEDPEKFTGRQMRKPKVVLSPGKAISRMLKDIRYEWLGTVEEVETIPCPREHFD